MNVPGIRRAIFLLSIVVGLLLQTTTPSPMVAQIPNIKKLGDYAKDPRKALACGGGAIGGYKLGQKMAEVESKRLKLSPEATAQETRKFEIGMAMALCGGGTAVEGTIYSKLTERDKKARQKEMDSAVADTAPGEKTYTLPDHPDMHGTITAQPVVAEGNNECRTVEDTLAESGKGDSALVKYCRKPPDGSWQVATM
jgi:surface antigen